MTIAIGKAGLMLGLFCFQPTCAEHPVLDENARRSGMLQQSKQRMTADNQFLKLQTKSLARGRMTSEMDSIIQQRAENTARLRGLRLAKEAQDQAMALVLPPAKAKRAKVSKISA
ncbi:hypothetical protein J2X48_005283 [Bosea sp. BE271]|uniref:hypothetical protein n=2 Tax=Boseaceae TaxID=2831100 RepID=UPI00285BE05F|nr:MULTISPECIES: hypothetical protein [Bosea]MCR4524533.1 hypothetical protein [Bosea sp. 47.2.35]MDR6831600.1 hypothetical protein [Bosea robiniae]MDR6898323.1 hypothetical protein [Bosea sp. BE109]MDR7141706.1 hypothetical protein [Bosea sp. BE168]MDR7178330.1 hypothetical protein [Bosea sp. BE271]